MVAIAARVALAAAASLLVMELFHVYTHLRIICGFSPYSVQQLATKRLYFMIDLASCLLSFLYLMPMSFNPGWLILALHFGIHLYYIIIWPTSRARAIMIWSSNTFHSDLDSNGDCWLFFGGTAFDILVHLWLCYNLTYNLTIAFFLALF